MLTENVKIGDRLEITLKRDKKSFKTYISQVEKILNDFDFIIQVPISYGQLVELPKEDKYSFLFFTEKGMLRFDADIISFIKEDGYNLMSVKLTSEGERIQRRVFFRFSCMLPVEVAVINDGTASSSSFEGVVKDIGGGGIRFVCNEDISEDAELHLTIDLNGDKLESASKVLHKQHFPKSAYTFQYRAVFSDIAHAQQERIAQFIYDEQRKQIQKDGI